MLKSLHPTLYQSTRPKPRNGTAKARRGRHAKRDENEHSISVLKGISRIAHMGESYSRPPHILRVFARAWSASCVLRLPLCVCSCAACVRCVPHALTLFLPARVLTLFPTLVGMGRTKRASFSLRGSSHEAAPKSKSSEEAAVLKLGPRQRRSVTPKNP